MCIRDSDKSKYEELLSEIDNSDVPARVKEFLRIAALRHIVFDYGQIADFYACLLYTSRCV